MLTDPNSNLVLYDAAQTEKEWRIVDDVVMGGRSDGHFKDMGDWGQYSGSVSLENNGGFSSARWSLSERNLEQYDSIALEVRGDGKRYQLRLKKDEGDRHAYIQYFRPEEKWNIIRLPLEQFYPSFRGRKLSIPNYDQSALKELGILIANKKAQDFKIEIKKIWLE